MENFTSDPNMDPYIYINITESPQFVHSNYTWEELREILIYKKVFNELGYPFQEDVDNELFRFDISRPSHIGACQEGLRKLRNALK